MSRGFSYRTRTVHLGFSQGFSESRKEHNRMTFAKIMRNEWIFYVLTLVFTLFCFFSLRKVSKRSTAVIYVYSPQDNSSLSNLEFFVRHGISGHERRGDGSETRFFIILQGVKELSSLPPLPRWATYIPHENICYDWGTWGWFLFHSGLINHNQFRYFVFINSSVRGPFLPSFIKRSWLDVFISLMSPVVKLAGPTINCESSGQAIGSFIQNPHVQSYAMVTDHVGLSTLFSAGVFTCRNDRWRTIYYSELSSSRSILDAGFSIDTFMLRYRGIDWHDKSYWQCNGGVSPLNEYSLDGTTVNPLDVMYVKVKDLLIGNDISSALLAVKYDQWSHSQTPSSIVRNDVEKMRSKLIQKALVGGPECFDSVFYFEANTDVASSNLQFTAFEHFIYFGQFEGRQYKKLC